MTLFRPGTNKENPQRTLIKIVDTLCNIRLSTSKHAAVRCLSVATKLLFIKIIQGDSGGICTTLGNDSMSDSKQKSSYEHGSDFERLRSYDRLKVGIEGNDY